MPVEMPPPPQIVVEADNGSAVRVRRGQTVEIDLPERPTTGFRWQVVTTPACCVVREDSFAGPAPGAPPGAPGVHSWRLEATRAGDGPFEVRLQPIAGRGGEPARTFSVTLTAVD